MKVALCLSGFVGNVGKWIQGDEIDPNEGFAYINDTVLSHGDVDVFIHSYSTNHESLLNELYSPKKATFEDNKDFKLNGVSKEELSRPYSFCVKSMWYSRKKAVELKTQYEEENNFKYDFVFLTRFDWAFFKKFYFEEYETDDIYVAGPILYSTALRTPYKHSAAEQINDGYFLSSSDNMNKIVEVFDTYDGIATEFNPKWPHESVSSHTIITEHIKLCGLDHKLTALYERPWQSSNTWAGDMRFLRAKPNVKTIKNT